MRKKVIGHRWEPITDLTERDRGAASNEMGALVQTWHSFRKELDPQQVTEFNVRIKREWAIETGIIEHLYTLDEGTTRLLIEQGIDASLIASDASNKAPEFVAEIIKDHADTVDWLFDAITNKRPLSTSFVKQLHAFMTRKQRFTVGIDQFGIRREVKLLHGEYKKWSNNPVRPDGKVHHYCPPEHVNFEMERLIKMHHEHVKDSVAPDVSTAWLHHRFTQIHPFQDGNGRVARAIASLVLIGAGWFPLVVTRKDRSRYIQALAVADEGNLTEFTTLIAELEKNKFIRALSIADKVRRETQRETNIDQMLEFIGDMFKAKKRLAQSELWRARQTADKLWYHARDRLKYLAEQLESRLGNSYGRQTWSDAGANEDDERRRWNRYQIVETARELDYFANTRDYHQWTRLGIVTENGRSEILISFHDIGPQDFRGIVGVSICFYRRQEADGIEHQIIELQPVLRDVFQINYKESPESVEERFHEWLEDSLLKALDQWRRGE